jgi:O-acetyl-ADP-ribose deacetylase (regulator of RNase III)
MQPIAERRAGAGRIILKAGDITKEAAGAIVNAANSSLLGGGGVDGAIHRAGGPAILAECKEIRARQGGCPTGQAVATTAGELPAGCVIHTVGPRWRGGGHGEEELLRSAYRSSLRLARERAVESIAFPSISTGAYGYPIHLAARTALRAIQEELESAAAPLEVRLVLFSKEDFACYREALEELAGEGG